MKLKEIYEKNAIRRYCDITKILNKNLELKSNPIVLIKKRLLILALAYLALVGLLFVNFDITVILVMTAIILSLFGLFIFGNKSTIKCEKDHIYFEQGFQKNIISYSKLKNVYIGRASDMLVFIPMYTYKLVLRYEDQFNFLREIEIPLLCIDSEEVNKFINNFQINKIIVPRYVSYDKRKIWLKIISFIITVAIIFAISYYIFANGIITNYL